jgi:pyruvate/2-oxoglutarate dehydrogenase complex dihydrolipoamide acyltransferase (E2) component
VSAAIEVRVPDIGGSKEVAVIELIAAPGERVAKEQGLLTLESDKATMEVPAPAAGVLKEGKVKVGDQVAEGQVLALFEVEEGAQAAPAAAAATVAKPEAAKPEAAKPPPATAAAAARVAQAAYG